MSGSWDWEAYLSFRNSRFFDLGFILAKFRYIFPVNFMANFLEKLNLGLGRSTSLNGVIRQRRINPDRSRDNPRREGPENLPPAHWDRHPGGNNLCEYLMVER